MVACTELLKGIALFSLLAVSCTALSASELQQLGSFASSKLKTELSGASSLEELFYGVEALDTLGLSAQSPKAAVCSALASAAPATVADMFYAVSLGSKLKCSPADLNKKAETAARDALSKADSTASVYHASSLLLILKQSGVKLSKVALSAVATNIMKDLRHSTGLFRSSKNAKLPTFLATGQVYLAAAACKQLDTSFDVASISEAIPQVLAAAKPNGGLWTKSDAEHVAATALSLAGAAALQGTGVDAGKLGGAVAFLQSFLPAGSLADAYHLALGFKATDGSSNLPKALLLEAGKTTGGPAEVTVRVSLHPALGSGKVPVCQLRGKAALGSDASYDVTFTKSDSENLYSASFTPKQLGTYMLSVTAGSCNDEVEGPRAALQYPVPVSAPATVEGLTVSVGGASGDKPSKLSYPSKLSAPLGLTHDGSIKVAFKVTVGGSATTPEQATVVLSSRARGVSAYFPAKSKAGALEAAITTAGIEKQLGTLSGMYSLALLVGDSSIAEAINWQLGSVQVTFKPDAKGVAPPDPAGLAVDALYKPKPAILHMHREPEKRPPALVSLVATGAALVPLLVLLLALPTLKANIKGFSASPSQLAFHLGIFSILVLFYLFWTQINLLQTLPILGLLGLFTFVAGFYALSSHADVRLKGD